MSRPTHLTILDELGMQKSMPASKTQFEWPANATLNEAPVVFLGLGPEPDKLPEWFDLSNSETLYFLESQDFINQVDGWEKLVPANFERITPDEFTIDYAASSNVVRYLPEQRAFPSFFGPLTARLTLGGQQLHHKEKTVWIPSTESDLLGKELTIAFKAKGYAVRFLDHELTGKHPGNTLPEMLKDGVPDLFFSINFKGLDHFGLGFNILREAGVKVAVWMVDNPFNLLTSVKSSYWKDARLFVTDHSFIGPLIEYGARWVTHLPLAACPEIFAEGGNLPDYGHDLEDKLVFVGRSEFPKKEKFFAGLTPDQALLNEAVTMLERGQRPDYHWWQERVPAQMWPGNEVRSVGIGAEVSGFAWRERCLGSVGKSAVIFGDDKWGKLDAITAEVRPLLDYYTTLPAVYRAASVNLNVTGMQLPAGLTQRHFDVWCAGGFLISDTNPGLKIFPDELTEAIRFTAPDRIREIFGRFRADSTQKEELRAAWQELILREHTYDNRAETVLTAMGL
ncbi:MAG: DUF3880 domain-containing protein [Pseudodesulfovibrio sp.]